MAHQRFVRWKADRSDRIFADDEPRLDAADARRKPSRDAPVADALRRAARDYLTRWALAGLRIQYVGSIRNLGTGVSDYECRPISDLELGWHATGVGWQG